VILKRRRKRCKKRW